MTTLKKTLTYLLAAFLIYGGLNHFLKPEMYTPFIPDFLPTGIVNYGSGLTEIFLGIGIFIPAFKKNSAYGIFILMLLFLPLHIWDIFKETPAIGSHTAALIRLPLQFLFIAWAWYVYKHIHTRSTEINK